MRNIAIISILFSAICLPILADTPIPITYPAITGLPVVTHTGGSNKIVAYFTNWSIYRGYTIADNLSLVANKLNYVLYAFADIDVASATAILSDPWADVHHGGSWAGSNFAQLQDLKAQFPSLKVLLSIGGATYSDKFNQVAAAGQLDTLAASCLDLLSHTTIEGTPYTYTGLFDGVDIDWEFGPGYPPSSNHALAYAYFIERLRQLINQGGQGYLLSAAMQAGKGNYSGSTAFDLTRIGNAINWCLLMAYDFHGPWDSRTGFNAPLYATGPACDQAAVCGYLVHHMPAAKITLGIPFYGHTYRGVPRGCCWGYQRAFKGPGTGPILGKYEAGTINYNLVQSALLRNANHGKNGYTYHWHCKSLVPWLYNSTGKYFVSYDDVRSLRAKVAYAKRKKLGGCGYWEASADTSNGTLVTALRTALS